MQKRTSVQVSELFKPGTNRPTGKIKIAFTPAGLGREVTAIVKKKNGNTARIEFHHPDKDGRPERVDISLNDTVIKLG